MRWLKLLLCAAITAALFIVGQFRLGLLPPLGKFLNPFAGFWQNGTQLDHLPERLDLPGLRQPVEVVWDNRHVPHIFAGNDHDLYFVQGYLQARDRLWQMDFIARAAAGRLSEVLGKRTLAFDRFRRRVGMLFAAERAVEALENDSTASLVMNSFAAGVNAYIAELKPAHLPVEFKLLDYRPEEWSPLKSALILKYMSWTLTGRFNEPGMTRTLERFGRDFMRRLYPLFPPLTDTIIPAGTPWKASVRPPSPPEQIFFPTTEPAPAGGNTQPRESNNWAVSGARTASGHPILCSDPHLGLNLPSIWYEMQLSAPGINVYGVTIPGLPNIIIGFNDSIAWGLTNAASDVLDWYVVQFDGKAHRRYRSVDGWKEVTPRIETILVRGGRTVVDTVLYTELGPIPYLEDETPFQRNMPRNAAMRWTAHDPSRELLTFHYLNRARGYEDYVHALSYFDNPAQNFAYADVQGNIAIWHNGRYPLRWREQGRYLLDAANPDHRWHGWVPRQEVPHVKNPPRGFISSANQAPVDPSYPYYLGWNYATSERGWRINEVLRSRSDFTPQDMMKLQNDVLNLRARRLLPALLPRIDRSKLAENERAVLDTLAAWNFENRAELTAPMIFEYFWGELYRSIWRDDFQDSTRRLVWPRSDVTIEMILNHPDSPFYDDRTTAQSEGLSDLTLRAFQTAVKNLEDDFGPMGPKWRWAEARGTDIRHLGQLPGFGRMHLPTNGNYAIVNATTRGAGPSWRMVVDMEPGNVHAWGVFPGGNSGNPGSAFYDSMVDAWVQGEYYPLVFLHSAGEKNEKIIAKTQIGVKR